MTKDLTTGKIMPILVKFTIPLVLGNLFQLTYNAVDSIIVGHFVGKEALAAVGICNPITTLMILFLNGLCMGAAILMGMQYGAKDYDTLHRHIDRALCYFCSAYVKTDPGRSVYYGSDSRIPADHILGTDVYIFI